MTDAAAGIRRTAQRDVAIGFEPFWRVMPATSHVGAWRIDSGQCGRDPHMQVLRTEASAQIR